MYTYFIILFFTVLFPLAYSFEGKRIAFYSKWKYLFPAVIVTALLFVVWDYYFTKWGVWGFNPNYITDIKILGLPIEEILFFIAIPFSCLFIYEVVSYYFTNNFMVNLKTNYSIYMALSLITLFVGIAIVYYDRWYTTTAFGLAAVVLLLHVLLYGYQFLRIFFVTYIFHLIPFFIVNGLLTYLPVVVYNDNENLGIRWGSIPLEDTVYSMSLLLINVTLYEMLKRNYQYKMKYNA